MSKDILLWPGVSLVKRTVPRYPEFWLMAPPGSEFEYAVCMLTDGVLADVTTREAKDAIFALPDGTRVDVVLRVWDSEEGAGG